MRRCVFYFDAARLAGRQDVEWIVCKECQAKLQRGTLKPAPVAKKHKPHCELGGNRRTAEPICTCGR